MPRPALDPGTWGKVRRATSPEGQAYAHVYYRDTFGRRAQMKRNGRTEPEAERILLRDLRQKLEEPEADLLSPSSTLSELADKYIDELKLKDPASGTINVYKRIINGKIRPVIGDLRISAATVPRIDRFLKGMLVTPGNARTSRTILIGMFALAVRQGAATKNVAKDTMPIPAKKRVVKAINIDDIRAMRELFAEYDKTHLSELHELSSILMATGCRIGEVLALHWDDVDLEKGVVRIAATLSNSEDGKLFRQEHPKSDAGQRGLTLPRTLLGALTMRRVGAHYDMVFPSSTGTYRWPQNTRTQWRAALNGSTYEGKQPRDFRKAVATHLARTIGTKAASDQLGHSSEDITTRHYIEAEETIADFSEALDTLFRGDDKSAGSV